MLVGEPGHLGPQAADAAHDQVDRARPPALARVQLLDQAPVDEAVHLRDDPRGPPGPGVLGLATDPRDEPVAQVAGREQEVVEAARPRVAGEEVEQLGQVLAERRRGW